MKNWEMLKLVSETGCNVRNNLQSDFHEVVFNSANTLLNYDLTWEVEQPKVEVTREMLAKAWDKQVMMYYSSPDKSNKEVKFDLFCKELGL